ncbi:hypothetical protein FB472_1452 [Rhodoglobus vestalii]|uniref:Uncharacterized protein n=1 Tax=Rhodoglobus vestalii TaxID=193384 RepID=A0A8H2K6K2_9MICO|nr:XRE family transcriptional regulator [Rhodoglobus vestalii]TQO19859.1 hypothetical protein FB472_1452 [Rhodoglobus vestalii]
MTNLIHTGNKARTSSHNRSTQISIQDISGTLAGVLGRQLLGSIVDKSPRSVLRWVNGETTPTSEDERRLRNAYQVYALLSSEEGDHTIRAWFMGMNPQLEDHSPAEALAEDRARDVMVAARAFINGA